MSNPVDPSLPDFVVISSGHGSSFRFDGTDPDNPPPPPYKTLDEAVRDADEWIGIADTIAGDARVVHVPSMTIAWPTNLAGRPALE